MDLWQQLQSVTGLAPAGFAALLAVLWLLAVAALSALATAVMRRRCLGPALASGVPILGFLTYGWGPVVGLAGLLAGMLALTFLLRGLTLPEPPAEQPGNG